MKIQYIITTANKTASEKTLKSIPTKDVVTVSYKDDKQEPLNKAIAKVSDDFTHIVIVDDGDILRENYQDVVDQYVKDDEAIYLPIVEYTDDEGNFKGFLNTCMHKAAFEPEVNGVLDFDLAKRGIDLYLTGAVIPTSAAKQHTFEKEVKYYTDINYIAKLTTLEKFDVISLPKVVAITNCDFTLKNVSKEDKIKYYKLAQTEGLPVIEENTEEEMLPEDSEV